MAGIPRNAEWREFEKLVARIEQVASAHSAVVKSPDRIRDLTTGQLREVDASIRHRVGTTEILITVECRKRRRREDDTWIEQLASKRQKIGAAKTIAVSATGFSKAAIKTAKSLGIELRTLAKVSAADIEGWFLSKGAVHVFRLIEDLRCFVVLYEDSGEPSRYGFWLPDSDIKAKHFYHEVPSEPVAIWDYFPVLERTQPELFAGVPLDGTRVTLEFPIQWEPGELHLATTTVGIPVHLTQLVANVSYQSAVCDIASGVHHEYAAPNGAVVQRTEFATELFGLPVTFEHQSDPSGEPRVACKFANGPELAPRSKWVRPAGDGSK
jgi:hypothetical protein